MIEGFLGMRREKADDKGFHRDEGERDVKESTAFAAFASLLYPHRSTAEKPR